jgi:hypothetical protein
MCLSYRWCGDRETRGKLGVGKRGNFVPVARPKIPVEERFFANVDTDGPIADLRPDLGPCWLWTGHLTGDGYPEIYRNGHNTHAHRVGWEIAWGKPIPKGLRLKHFACTRRLCVNPDHVRPKVAVENVLGSINLAEWNEGRSHCVMGHQFTKPNIIYVPGGWACRECRIEVARERRKAS